MMLDDESSLDLFGVYLRHSYGKQMSTTMPNVLGISYLSKPEIRKDIRDIERSLLEDNTDSDSSVKSEDILASTYPVKPRKTTRNNFRHEKNDQMGNRHFHSASEKFAVTVKNAEESLDFLRAIQVSKKHLFDGEMERERLEGLIASYKGAISEKNKKLAESKRAQENYVQMLQGVFAQSMRLKTALSRQVCMLLNVNESLQKRRDCVDQLEKDITASKAMLYPKGKAVHSAKKPNPDDTAVLRVTVKKTGKVVVLFRHQTLRTSMGPGQVESIHPVSGRVVIRLPFGMLYSCLSRAVGWAMQCDETSDESIKHKLNALKSTIQVPIDARIAIQAVIGHSEDEHGTDQEESTSDESHSPQTTGESQQSMDSLVTAATSANPNSIISAPTPQYFPLSATAKHSHRSDLKRSLEGSLLSSQDFDTLKLAYSSPAALPAAMSLVNHRPFPEARLCSQALSTDYPCRLGTAGLLTWGGDVQAMKSTLEKQYAEITALQEELTNLVQEAERTGGMSKQVVKATTAVRLGMFTRRVRHRQNLNASLVGVSLPTTHISAFESGNPDCASSRLAIKTEPWRPSQGDESLMESDDRRADDSDCDPRKSAAAMTALAAMASAASGVANTNTAQSSRNKQKLDVSSLSEAAGSTRRKRSQETETMENEDSDSKKKTTKRTKKTA